MFRPRRTHRLHLPILPSLTVLRFPAIYPLNKFRNLYINQHGRVTPELLHLLQSPCTSLKSTSTTPDGHPTLLSPDKMSNTAAAHACLTVQQLSCYLGFYSLKNWDNLYDVCQPTFSLIKSSETPLELGAVANIKKSRQNKTPVPRPSKFLEVVHCDIGYGDCKSVGNGATYCLMLVDRATRYTWVYPLQNLRHDSITSTFKQWFIDSGSPPARLYTDFDPKILEGHTSSFLCDHNIIIQDAPSGHQNQNGLVERAWETVTCMAQAYITDMQMPKSYWYWAISQGVQAINYIPCNEEGISTTPHELAYGVKPDLCTLFRLFSTGYFKHTKDGSLHRSGISTSHSMQGITLGRCWKSDGMIFYSPHTKEL
jgi:hypothetical protein